MKALEAILIFTFILLLIWVALQMYINRIILLSHNQKKTRILLNEDTRFLIRKAPGSFYAHLGELKMSWWHLIRDIRRKAIEPALKWLNHPIYFDD